MKKDTQPRARLFATFISIMWLAYATGFWYASKFVNMGVTQVKVSPMLFTSVLLVWFVAYFVAVAWWLIRRPRPTSASMSGPSR
jgi:hypothetical protein